jgi:hypothetical protein
VQGVVLEGASLGTVGKLPCLSVGTGKSGPVVAKDSMAQWLERCTTQSTMLVVQQHELTMTTTYASPPHVKVVT